MGQAACWDDRSIPGLRRIADAIHSQRAIAGFQLMDCGRVGAVNVDYRVETLKAIPRGEGMCLRRLYKVPESGE